MRLLASLTFVMFCSIFAEAQGTHLWSQSSAAEFERGTPAGVAISSLGRLEFAPEARALVTTGSTFVWSVAAAKSGDAYLATGSPAGVLRVTAAGVQTKLFLSKDLTVQVVRVAPDGGVYAATLPSGRVYRLDPTQSDQDEAKATLVFDPAQTAEKPRYVWDMAFDNKGHLYLATGAPGGIYRVTLPGGASKPELVYASDEPHIRALLFNSAGELFAGSDGSGLVYRIAQDGKAFVLFEANKREITALAFGAQGQLYISAVGERGRSPLPPLPVQGSSSVTATLTIVQPGSVQAFNGNTVIPEGSDIYEIPSVGNGQPDARHDEQEAAPRRLWSSHDDIVYALLATADGLLAATGNRGHVYRIAEDGSYADLAHLLASQVTGFADGPVGLYTATANTGKLYLLDPRSKAPANAQTTRPQAMESTYESDVFDAQVHSQWGRAEVLAKGGYELYARTGNVENPLRGWTDWKRVTANDGEPGLTPARYLQWKAVLSPGAAISSVGINYLPANLAPSVDDIVVVPGTRANAQTSQAQLPQQTSISFGPANSGQGFDGTGPNTPLAAIRDKTAVTARWAAHDDNGDELQFALLYRSEGDAGGGDSAWRLLKDKLVDRFYTFDASLLPDGAYRMKVVASDAPSHPPGEALSAERESAGFLIDTATPQVTGLAAAISGASLHVTATASDAATPITRAEYSVDAGPWQYVEPTGRLSDALVEHYDFLVPLEPVEGSKGAQVAPRALSAEHTVTLRVMDRYENAGSAKAIARAAAQFKGSR